MKLLDSVKAGLSKKLPAELVELLIKCYTIIKTNFILYKHENTELNASKLSEAVYRILEFYFDKKYSPIDKHISKLTEKCRQFEQRPSAGEDDSLRIHIPRTIILIVDIRNKRGVGHISGIHDPNLCDSTLVVSCSDWIMAELLRLFGGFKIDEAQRLVDQLIDIKYPLIYQIDDVKRVLEPRMSYTQKVLLLLRGEYPSKLSDRTLFEWVEHSNFSIFKRDVLKQLHKRKQIEYSKTQCLILPPGITEVDAKIQKIYE